MKRGHRRQSAKGEQPPPPAWFDRFLALIRKYHAGTIHPKTGVQVLATSVQELGEEQALAAWAYCLETTQAPTKVLWEFSGAPKAFIPPPGWVPTGQHNPQGRNAKACAERTARSEANLAEALRRIEEQEKEGATV